MMDIRDHNRIAWDKQVQSGNRWTIPVSREAIAAARRGEWEIFLTPTKPVPRDWFPPLGDLNVLCLASGGGQQAPVLAAAGARVTVLDNSPRQLEQDRLVADRDSLSITTVQGDMADLSRFPDGSFELIVHPVSNSFVPDVIPVWKESFRVLSSAGALLAAFTNPLVYLFDYDHAEEDGVLRVRYTLPYSDLESRTEAEKQRLLATGQPVEFSHTLEDQIGGQIDAGYVLTGLYEDSDLPEDRDLLGTYTNTYIATRSVKPSKPDV